MLTGQPIVTTGDWRKRHTNPYRFKLAGRDEMGKCSYVVMRLDGAKVTPIGTYETDGLSWVYEGLDGEYWVGCSSEVHANRAKTKLIRHLLGLGVH